MFLTLFLLSVELSRNRLHYGQNYLKYRESVAREYVVSNNCIYLYENFRQ